VIEKENNMCPACLTTTAVVLAGATTTGGVAAVLVKKLIRSNQSAKGEFGELQQPSKGEII